MLLGAVRWWRSGSGPPSPLRCVARAVAQRVQCAECWAAAGMLAEQGTRTSGCICIYSRRGDQVPRLPTLCASLPQTRDSVNRHSRIIGAPTFFAGFLAVILLQIWCDGNVRVAGRCGPSLFKRKDK